MNEAVNASSTLVVLPQRPKAKESERVGTMVVKMNE